MPPTPSTPPAAPLAEYVEDGARIAGILLVWGVLSGLFTHGVADLGLPFGAFWAGLGTLFAATGVLNAVLYVLYRTVDHYRQSA
ncbi:hypothetical protein [Halobacterium yunchengense]|uniref:hypothetical protein n=1 Tax=Halobacterium yunchengense TaxID=3108497 RepID=UPI00300BF62E